MRSLGVATLLLFLGCVMILASPVPIPHPSPSTFSVTEYSVDANGLWSDHEIPLSDASMQAIREATPATEEDIHAWNAEAEPDMQIQVIEEKQEENSDIRAENEHETDNENETEAENENENENENETGNENETEAEAEAEHENENETESDDEMAQQDDLEITQDSDGRMLLIPRSPRLQMRHILRYLTHLISKLKARTPLARLTLKLKVEPVTTPTPTPTPIPTPTRRIRPTPQLGIRYRPRPVSLRLVPSRQLLYTRRILARCQMLLRWALQRMRTMRQMMMRERMKRLGRIRGFRFPGRGVILFRSNNITATGPAYQSTTSYKLEIEGEKNSTVTIIAPHVNATFPHSVIVINRGTLILMNRSRNNTLSIIPHPSSSSHSRRRFWIPRVRTHTMNVDAVDHHEDTQSNLEITPAEPTNPLNLD